MQLQAFIRRLIELPRWQISNRKNIINVDIVGQFFISNMMELNIDF